MCRNIVPADWLACVGSLEPFFDKKEDRLSLLRSSPSNHQVSSLFAQLQSVPPCRCVSREVHQREAFFEKFKPLWNPTRPATRCLKHLGIAIGRPMPSQGSPGFEHRIGDLSPPDLAPGICNRSPDAFEGSSVYEVILKLPQLAHGPQTCT